MQKITEFLDRPVTMAHAFAGMVGIIIAIFIFSSTADAAEFKKGSEYNVLYVQGTAHLTCQGFYNGRYITLRRSVSCYDSLVSPGSYSRFIHAGSEATKVKLTNGSVDKTKKFYAEKGESKNFNLLIRTLFQKPLLHEGINDIDYQLLLEDGTVEESGDFEVFVETAHRRCRPLFLHSNNLYDCQNGSQPQVCNEYFYRARCL